jgi:hypothetical protein
MATGTLNIVFETSKSKSGSIKLTPEQFEKFKALMPDIKGFARCVKENILPPDTLLIDNYKTSDDGWSYQILPIDENINVRIRWNTEKGIGLITIMGPKKHFTMSAGSFLRFEEFICNKLTNAVRMWQDILAATVTLRASLFSTFKPEDYFMAPKPTFQDPVELEDFSNNFFNSA